MNLAFIYAGQGSQKEGMGKDLYQKDPLFKKTFEELDPKGEIKRLCFDSSLEELSITTNTQPCMVAFAIAITKVLFSHQIIPKMALGLSLGEYSALFAAGAFDEKTAIKLISFRAKAMSEATQNIDTSMLAILGLERDLVKKACQNASPYGIVEISNYNCPGQIVIGGEKRAVEKAKEIALSLGAKRCVELKVSIPSHTSLMKEAGNKLAPELEKINFAPLNFPVIFNATASPLKANESISQLLIKQIQSSVYLEDSIRFLDKEKIDTVIEIGAGKVLSGFIRKISPSIKSYAIEDYESLNKTLIELGENKRV